MSGLPPSPIPGPAGAFRLRVGFLSERADFYGGGQKSLLELASHLRAAGGGACEPVVVLPDRGPLHAALEARGVECEILALPSWRRAPLAALRSCAGLLSLARRRRLDLLHTDSPRAALYAGLAARLTGRRHVWHLRASRPVGPPLERLLLGLCDRVIAVSRATAGRSVAVRGSSKVRVVPTGLPPIEFLEREAARARLGLPADEFVIGVVGRLEPDKGGADAIAALPAIRGSRPDATLVFVGATPAGDRHAEALRSLAAAIGVAPAVRFAGEHPEAAPLLPAFDLIVHPSSHEALPRVLIEALFAGVPVVATAVGGIPEVIENGRCGLLVRPGDPLAIARAAATLAGDPELRRRFGEQGRARARELFSIEAMVQRILGIYGEIVPRAAAPAADRPAGPPLWSEGKGR